MTSRVPSPRSRAVAAARRSTARGPPDRGRRRGPSGPRPASNCGLTSATMSAAAGASVRRTRAEHEAERDERHVDRDEARPVRGASSAVRVRAFVRSMETTRGSARSDSASWPRPDVEGVDAAAPRCSRTSVKPPVDAPTSRQTRPLGSISNASSAAASLWPPRTDVRLRLDEVDGVVGSRSRRACGRAAPRRPRRPAPCRPARAPAPGCASRPGRARRGAGRVGRGAASPSPGSPGYRGTAAFTAARLGDRGRTGAKARRW